MVAFSQKTVLASAMLVIATGLVYWRAPTVISSKETAAKILDTTPPTPGPNSPRKGDFEFTPRREPQAIEAMLPVQDDGIRESRRRPAFDKVLFQASAANAKSPQEACKAWRKLIPLLSPAQASVQERSIGWLNIADACSRGAHRTPQEQALARHARAQLSQLDGQDDAPRKSSPSESPAR